MSSEGRQLKPLAAGLLKVDKVQFPGEVPHTQNDAAMLNVLLWRSDA